MGDARIDALERFWSNVASPRTSEECWLWTGSLRRGYGRFMVSRTRSMSAHRWLYQETYGPVPEGLVLDHVCHNNDLDCRGGPTCPHRACVNPGHLEAVVQRVNLARGRNGYGQRTHCKYGHEYTPENTRWYRGRVCLACRSRWDSGAYRNSRRTEGSA